MNIRLATSPVCLAKNQVLSLTGAKGSAISCRRGSLWITQDHDLRDIVLAAGESFTLDHRGPTIVSALADSWVAVLPRAGQSS